MLVTYTCAALFLYNNYVQALTLLCDMPMAISTLAGDHPTPYQTWLDQERNYLDSKLTEPDADIMKREYVALLTKAQLAK